MEKRQRLTMMLFDNFKARYGLVPMPGTKFNEDDGALMPYYRHTTQALADARPQHIWSVFNAFDGRRIRNKLHSEADAWIVTEHPWTPGDEIMVVFDRWLFAIPQGRDGPCETCE